LGRGGAFELAGTRRAALRSEAVPSVLSPAGSGYLHTERKKPGVTLELLHLEYLEQHPDGYRYSQFCEYYREWLAKHRLSLCQVHRAGEKQFVDYAGKKPFIVDPGR